MLPKIKVFAYICNENLQKQVQYFLNGVGGGGRGARRVGPGSAFANYLDVHLTLQFEILYK